MTQNATSEQKEPVSILDVVGFYVDLAVFLPRNKAEIPPAFRELLEENRVSQAGTDYIRRIDHKHVLSPGECVILAEEGTYYLLRLQYYYVWQMLRKTTWQSNVAADDARLETTADLFAYFSSRVEACLRAFGVSEEYSYRVHADYLIASERYLRKRTWGQAVRVGNLYTPLSKLMRLNMTKRIVMTDAKQGVIDSYSAKIHGVAAKFYRKLEKDYRYVGIQHFEQP